MCEIFPEVTNFLVLISLRVGMVIISVIGIVTGSLSMALLEGNSHISLIQIKNITSDVAIVKPEDALIVMSRFSQFIPTGLGVMATLFVLASFILLFSTLTDQEGFTQMFVWTTFLNVMFGFFLIFAISYECCTRPVCFLSHLDWLTGAASLTLAATFLFIWIYFIIVANSYVVLGGM